MFRSPYVLVAALILSVLGSTQAWAQRVHYLYTPIATASESAGLEPFTVLGHFPALNAQGEVAFLGGTDPAIAGGTFYRSDGVLLSSLGLTGSIETSAVALNDAGQIARVDWGAAGGPAVVRTDGFTTTTIAVLPDCPILAEDTVALNNAGQVVFTGCAGALQAVFIGDGTILTPIADSSNPLFDGTAFTVFPGAPAINDAGQVVFNAVTATGTVGLFLAAPSGGPVTQIASTSAEWAPHLDAEGRVAYRQANDFGDVEQILQYEDGTTTTVLDAATSEFFSLGQDDLSDGITPTFGVAQDDGGIVFWGVTDAEMQGVFTEMSPVLLEGDALLGSTVLEVAFGRHGTNDAGQVAMFARLGDGRTAIVRADPLPVVNELIVLTAKGAPQVGTDILGCPDTTIATATIRVRMRPRHNSPPLSQVALVVKRVGIDNAIQNGVEGVGTRRSLVEAPLEEGYADGILRNGEGVTVPVTVCISARRQVRLVIDAVAVPTEEYRAARRPKGSWGYTATVARR